MTRVALVKAKEGPLWRATPLGGPAEAAPELLRLTGANKTTTNWPSWVAGGAPLECAQVSSNRLLLSPKPCALLSLSTASRALASGRRHNYNLCGREMSASRRSRLSTWARPVIARSSAKVSASGRSDKLQLGEPLAAALGLSRPAPRDFEIPPRLRVRILANLSGPIRRGFKKSAGLG